MAGATRKFSLYIRFAATLQFLLTVGMLSTLSFSIASPETYKEMIVGFISLISCIFGFAGAWRLNRSFILFYSITQLWGLMMTTQYLYLGLNQVHAEVEYCRQDTILTKFDRAASGEAKNCDYLADTATAKMVFGAFIVFVTWSTSLLAMILSEKVQDLERAKKDKTLALKPYRPDMSHMLTRVN